MYKLEAQTDIRPILKWAGGKTQLLSALASHIPSNFSRYVEPFIGGGALFFALQPEHALISDSNPELVNLYQQVANDVEAVIRCLKDYENTREMFYDVRGQDWQRLAPCEAAARMIYLNRTCFNGLYRVNRKGKFNVPFGNYRNPSICDEKNLRAAAEVLKRAEIVCCDFSKVLGGMVRRGDFVFLDPPYVPVGKWGDFKRYTKEQFSNDDQVRLSQAVEEIHRNGVWAVLTNSNHPFVHKLYSGHNIDIVQTKRNISSNGAMRRGEDVIVDIIPTGSEDSIYFASSSIPRQAGCYPKTRFMGSKRKLLREIWQVASRFDFDSAIDLFSGSGIVGYLFKSMGKAVTSNDYMAMSAVFSKAMIENNAVTLSDAEIKSLLRTPKKIDSFVSDTFKGLFFSDQDNATIDVIRTNIARLRNPYKIAIAKSALIRACSKKRARGLFTYVGDRYDDGRKDLKLPMAEQFIECVKAVNGSVFDNGKTNRSVWGNALDLTEVAADLVYMDPPYYTPKSDNEYVRRYHFLEGLARDWNDVQIQTDTKTKKFRSYPTPFATRDGAVDAFTALFKRYANSIIIVSYSSNSLPTKDEMVSLMSKYKNHVDVVPIDYRYNFGNRSDGCVKRQNVKEYLFIGY
ncbi:MAG: Dam family site-specific DNA-(adenine-N6)-methyltransferase [Kiritimatiellae bacterium]|nr:Dam family site-specific DNA-(adenine-N6)-methyltransferase [Kiritimatiellia bacterium]